MSCARMEYKILGYVDGRLKESERLEVEKHLAACAACRLRVKGFHAVSSMLDELPQIEPSAGFDARVRARVAAEPVKHSWWAWLALSPRVAFAAMLLLLATMWIGSRPRANDESMATLPPEDVSVLENYDVLSNFEPLTELPPPVQADDSTQTNQ